MTMNAEHKRKKAEAMAESKKHYNHSSVLENRDGMKHEDHKSMDMARDDRDRGVNMNNPNDQESSMF